MDRFFQLFVIDKFPFITEMESDELVNTGAIININNMEF